MNDIKKCSKCLKSKPLCDFGKSKNGNLGLRADCKVCHCNQSKTYQKKNLSEVLKKNALWVSKNISRVKEWRENYVPIRLKRLRDRYKNDLKYRENTLESVSVYRRDPKNKNAVRLSRKNWEIKERARNPMFRVVGNLRRRLCFLLNGKRKSAHSMELIGCSTEHLRSHMESQFTAGMKWDNYGLFGWHIDHIKPCDSFDLSQESEQRKCFHYSNLQPLWAKDNIRKSNKV